MCEEELSLKCSDFSVLYKGRGVICFECTDHPAYLLKELKSVERLCSYLCNHTIDPDTFVLDDIIKYINESKWTNALDLWHLTYPNRPNPNDTEENSVMKFRATGTRKGKHNVTSQQLAAEVGGDVHSIYPHWKAKMKGFDLEVIVDLRETQLLIAIALCHQKLSLRNRIELGTTTLNSCIAYGLVKLAGIKEGDVVLDPMAGVGMIPIECSLEYPTTHCICSDIKDEDVQKANINIKAFSGGYTTVLHADATRMPFLDSSVDVVVTDLPFGHRHGSYTANRKLYPQFFQEMTRVITDGGRAVMMTMEKKVMRRTIGDFKIHGWVLDFERTCDVGGFQASIFKVTMDRNLAQNIINS